jgi:molybdenum-dependent DNA-binding transcriptional regulator ModE
MSLGLVSCHVRLIEEEQKGIREGGADLTDIQLRIVEAEKQIDEVQRVLSEHRSTHCSISAPGGK